MIQFQNTYVSMFIVEERRREAAEWRLSRQVPKGAYRHPQARPILGATRLRRALGMGARRSGRSGRA